MYILSERICLRAPPGYESKTEKGEEEILELHRAIYGLKQASASFWEAISSHLKSIGFVPMIGDPCLMKRVDDDGNMVLVCLYVDDVTYAVSHPAWLTSFKLNCGNVLSLKKEKENLLNTYWELQFIKTLKWALSI